MRAPAFWETDTRIARLLSPLGVITRYVTAYRMGRSGWSAPVPVICCGNVTVGGSGKTTLAIDLIRRLVKMGYHPHALLRGYRGTATGTRQVFAGDASSQVGDEALLLAAEVPTWIGGDRGTGARMAVGAGADVLVMDDGLQNPTLRKTLSLLVIDGAVGFGNERLLPAGPLREDVASTAERCQAAILIGDDATGALARLPSTLPVLHARLQQDAMITTLRGRRIVAFSGISRPAKFFDPLVAAGANLVGMVSFPDHHPFTAGELRQLQVRSTTLDAILVTTPKDAVRLPAAMRSAVTIIGVSLEWDQPAELDAMLRRIMGGGLSCPSSPDLK